ncbi:MAG: helix-turn-helix domain-containing protein [Bryobacteraceae bacterium]
MSLVGDRLRDERTRRGLDLTEIAASTRIPSHYLQAIEGDDQQALPSGGFFYRSFVRQYAAALGLQDREIHAELERMASEAAPPPVPGQHSGAEKTPKVPSLDKISWAFAMSPTVRSLVLLIVAVGACSGFYSWWKKAAREKVPEIVAAVSKPHPQRTVARKAVVRSAPVTGTPASKTSLKAPATETTTGNAPASPGDHLELSLQAIEATWLSVALDGKLVFSGLLQPNEVKTVDGQEIARLRLGNAGGVQVRWNGREVGPFGARGQVRTVVFTRDKYEVVPPKPAGDSASGDSAETDVTQ